MVEVFDRILLDPDQRVRYHFVLIDYLCRPIGGRLVAGSDVADAVLASPDELARLPDDAEGGWRRRARAADGGGRVQHAVASGPFTPRPLE